MAATQIVKTATGTAISVNGIIIDPSGAANNNTLVYNSATNTFVPAAGGSASTGNWTFSGNNADVPSGVIGIGLTTAGALTIGHGSTFLTTFAATALGATQSIAVSLANSTQSTSGATVQLSPALEFMGHAWNTTATASDKANSIRMYLAPVTGTATRPRLWLQRAVDGGAYADWGYFDVNNTYPGISMFSGDGTTEISAGNGAVSRIVTSNHMIQQASGYITIQSLAVGVAGTGLTGYTSMFTCGVNWQNNQGYCMIKAAEVMNSTDISNYGTITLVGHSDGLGDGHELLVDAVGIATQNTVVVFSGSKKVSVPAATANLQTWAGVIVNGGTANGRALVINRGRVYVRYTGTVAAGDTVVTSSTTAGYVQTNNAATGRSIIGVAMEAGGATTAGYVQILMA